MDACIKDCTMMIECWITFIAYFTMFLTKFFVFLTIFTEICGLYRTQLRRFLFRLAKYILIVI